MEQKILSAEPRRSFSNEFKLQMVKLASQPGASVARIAREHDINDNLLFKWLRLLQNEGRVSRRLPVTTSSDTGVELLPVEITPESRKNLWRPLRRLYPLPLRPESVRAPARWNSVTVT
ncbi:transposase [Escherichia coli]|nr:transposase [Escherichia coli]MCZ0390699.1 transposase [Escherichia coli]